MSKEFILGNSFPDQERDTLQPYVLYCHAGTSYLVLVNYSCAVASLSRLKLLIISLNNTGLNCKVNGTLCNYKKHDRCGIYNTHGYNNGLANKC